AGRLAALVVARDAAPSALGRLPAEARTARVIRCGSRETLGRAIGRGPVAIVAVTDVGLAARIEEGTGIEEVRESRTEPREQSEARRAAGTAVNTTAGRARRKAR
ncbi:MAG: hypothetical protein ACRELC_00925, partial [Gemmatimonadota bacterium]